MTGTGWIADVAAALVPALLNGLWQGIVLAGVVGLVLWGLGTRYRLSAATRYAAWFVALLAVVALPFAAVVSSLAPSPDAVAVASDPGGDVVVTAPTRTSAGSFRDQVSMSETTATGVRRASAAPGAHREATALVRPVLGVPAGGWVVSVFVVWLLGAAWLSVRIVRSFVFLQRLKRQSRPVPPAVHERLAAWLPVAGRRSVRLATSDVLPTPVAAGVLDPTILVPAALLDDLTPDELDQVVLHELAHLARWDDWTHLVQRGLEALFFFHPVVRGVGRWMDRERERACDDWVVARTRRPRSYASCLTRLVELNVRARTVHMAPGMAVRKGQIVERVRRVLDPASPAFPGVSRRVLGAAAGAVVVAVLLVVVAAPVVVLTDRAHAEGRGLEPVATDAAAPDRPAPDSSDAVSSSATGRSAPAAAMPVEQPEAEEADGGYAGSDGAGRQAGAVPLPLQDVAPGSLPTPTLREAPGPAPAGPAGPDLSVASWIKVLRAARGISSSGERAEFLLTALERMPDHPDVMAAYIETAGTISSSGDQTRALSGLLAAHRLDRSSWLHLLGATATIRSSGDKARLLLQSADLLPDDDAVHAAYLDAAERISSASERRRVLAALVQAEHE